MMVSPCFIAIATMVIPAAYASPAVIAPALAATTYQGSRTSESACSTDPLCLSSSPLPPHSPDAQRVIIKHGPFTVPGMNDQGGMKSFDNITLTMPCSDCLITHIRAGLEYPDGSYANVDTGMWLHHAVVYNQHRPDTTCPSWPERFFASGNERTAVDLTLNGTTKAGYPIPATHTAFGLLLELMNQSPQPRPAVLTLDWEFLPSSLPANSLLTVPIWLDIDGVCGAHGSELPAPADEPVFALAMSSPWTSTLSGSVIFTAGHLHDGGTELEIVRGGRTVCSSVARYGEEGGFVGLEQMGDGMEMEMEHISSMSGCAGLGFGEGEEWAVRAKYDFGRHEPMMDGGKAVGVMGIALMYVAREGGAGSG